MRTMRTFGGLSKILKNDVIGYGHLQIHFQKCSFRKCKSQKCKNKKIFSEDLGWSKKSFESVFFKSVEIESVVVSAHPHIHHALDGGIWFTEQLKY